MISKQSKEIQISFHKKSIDNWRNILAYHPKDGPDLIDLVIVADEWINYHSEQIKSLEGN
jgi:hypothetical protein